MTASPAPQVNQEIPHDVIIAAERLYQYLKGEVRTAHLIEAVEAGLQQEFDPKSESVDESCGKYCLVIRINVAERPESLTTPVYSAGYKVHVLPVKRLIAQH